MSFDEVYRNYYNELRRFSRQLSLSAESSEDIIQDTFLKFYLELNKNIEFNNPRAWLYKVFLNQFRTRMERDNLINGSNGQLAGQRKFAGDLHEDYIKNERRQIVIQMLEKMVNRDKEILMLYHNGFSYAEMSEITGISPNSIGKTLVRAIESLKETIKIHYHELFEQN
jgi:RNA polymerase sigma-70 factor (ECF subfamily)